MRWYTIDKVVREALGDKELPLHFSVRKVLRWLGYP
jgi:hypothetical protein